MPTDNERRISDGTIWREFCRELESAGEIILREDTPSDPFTRAEGFRYLTRLLRAGLDAQLEFGDPRYPGFYQLANETIKIGNDNPDNIYHNASIDGRYDYRISGTRGTVPYISWGTKAGGYGSDGTMEPTGQLDSANLGVADDGSFEICVSREPKPGNWLPMTETTTSMIVRQTFFHRDREEPARYTIECLNPDGDDRLDVEAFECKLRATTSFVRGTATLFADWMADYSRHINELPADDQAKCQAAGGDANIHYLQSYWRLGADEALVIDAKIIPECSAWNFQLSNFWMESLDYRYHRISINKHTAQARPDGSVRIVVAHRNPGPQHPNWLETCGHQEGGMLFRWIEAEEHPGVDTRVVKHSELAELD